MYAADSRLRQLLSDLHMWASRGNKRQKADRHSCKCEYCTYGEGRKRQILADDHRRWMDEYK